MNVPNHEKKAFLDMSDAEKLAIINAKLEGTCEVLAGEWVGAHLDGVLCLESIYRTMPRQLVIPWEHIKPEYKWAAMDEDGGNIYFYKVEPKLGREEWSGGVVGTASALNIPTTGIDWRESLTARPEVV